MLQDSEWSPTHRPTAVSLGWGYVINFVNKALEMIIISEEMSTSSCAGYVYKKRAGWCDGSLSF
jgi:hypothetical protein